VASIACRNCSYESTTIVIAAVAGYRLMLAQY
jgi:hypothetical protein